MLDRWIPAPRVLHPYPEVESIPTYLRALTAPPQSAYAPPKGAHPLQHAGLSWRTPDGRRSTRSWLDVSVAAEPRAAPESRYWLWQVTNTPLRLWNPAI